MFISNITTANSIFRNMSKVDKLKEKYQADAQMMASKSRFGYFSILPSHTAAITDNSGPTQHHQPDGKVSTQPRNIYSGVNGSGTLKKSYFSYSSSVFHGSAYQDPGKSQRILDLKEREKWKGKDVYKPAKLNQTLAKASYEYMSETDPKKGRKNHRGSDGKVITQNSNILISPQSKIDFQRIKDFKYMECPPKKLQLKKEQSEEKSQQEHFRVGSPHKELFTSNSEAYFDADIKPKPHKKRTTPSVGHDAPFRPSCVSPGKDFVKVTYKEEGIEKEEVKPIKKENKTEAPFKLIKVQHNSKPTPSISLSKINLLRGYR